MILQSEVSRGHATGTSFLLPETDSTNSLNQTRQYSYITLIQCLTWWIKLFKMIPRLLINVINIALFYDF
jgi:hypothetical protein